MSQAYTSVSFYTRNEIAYYAINDRSAGKKVIELDLMTEPQHNELPEDEEITAADRLIIDSPKHHGPDRDEGARRRTGPDAAGASFACSRHLRAADRSAGQGRSTARPALSAGGFAAGNKNLQNNPMHSSRGIEIIGLVLSGPRQNRLRTSAFNSSGKTLAE